MLIRWFIEMAFATSILNFLSIITFLSFSTDNALSQSVIQDLMMMSPEWQTFQDADNGHNIHHRSRRDAVNPKDWFMPTKGCHPTCRKGVPTSVCSNPPTRKELCTLLNNADWCCQEWAFSRPQSLSFKPNCDVACVAYAPCPYSTCRLCAEINNEHACCQARNCTTEKVFKAPDGTAVVLTEITQLSTRSAANEISPSAGACTDPPDTICNHFNGKPSKCRLAAGCAYLCASGNCENSGTVYGNECFDNCFNHCFDKCGCTARPNCLWLGDQEACRPKLSKYCNINDFPGKECARKDVYYSIGGKICFSRIQKGYCDLDFVVASANLGSDKAKTDSEGIEYLAEADSQKEDPLGLSQSISFTPEEIIDDSSLDQQIYATAVVGNLKACRNETEQCIHYVIPSMTWDGDYELGLRLVEGVYSERNKRRFSVRFAGVEIFSEFDILSYTGEKNKAMDLYANFKVSRKGKMITVKGHKTKPLNSTAKLSLCRAECGQDNSFIMSAFHVIKQMESKPKTLCDLSKIPECDLKFFAEGECKRGYQKTTYYAFGGKYCRSSTPSPSNYENCGTAVIKKAINLGGMAITDSRDIRYEQDSPTQSDDLFGGSRVRNSYKEAVGYEYPQDRDLYNTLAYADAGVLQECAEECNKYTIIFDNDGHYELAVRTADDESDGPNQRKFNVLLGNTTVFPDVDLFHLTQNKSQAADLTLNFDVTDDASKIRLKGFSSPDDVIELPEHKGIQLSFCTSQCENTKSRSWLAGAFSVINYDYKPLARAAAPANNVGTNICENGGGGTCGCRTRGACEYNLQSDHCGERAPICSMLRPSRDECRRGGSHVFYTQAGQVCPTTGPSGNCTLDRVMLAVNLGNTVPHKDINGIAYVTMNDTKFTDPDGIRNVVKNASTLITAGVPLQDLEIYRTYEYGGKSGMKNIRCVSIKIPSGGDGEYELSIKIGETYYTTATTPPKRAFSYKLNGQYIVQNFEPMTYAIPTTAMDLNTNFRITESGTKLELRGQASSMINSTDGSVEFEICNGQCSWSGVDNNYRIGAFSVVKLKKSRGCEVYNGNACACRFANCQYNVVTQKCEEGVQVCAATCDISNQCQRGGDYVFYVRGGHICTNSVQFGNCEVEKTMLAINFFGPSHTDVNGINFQSEAGIPYHDPYDVRRNGTAYAAKQFPVEGVPAADLVLYSTSMFSASFNELQTCVTYHVPTSGDGHYELGLKLAEVWYMQKGQREFSYYFNEQLVVQSLDMAAVRDAPNKGFDLIVNFRIVTDRLQMKGYPHSVIKSADGSVPLAFCPGTCDCDWKDHNFQVAAVFVNKFKNVPSPSSYKAVDMENFDNNIVKDDEWSDSVSLLHNII